MIRYPLGNDFTVFKNDPQKRLVGLVSNTREIKTEADGRFGESRVVVSTDYEGIRIPQPYKNQLRQLNRIMKKSNDIEVKRSALRQIAKIYENVLTSRQQQNYNG
jgi:hypothetical protein